MLPTVIPSLGMPCLSPIATMEIAGLDGGQCEQRALEGAGRLTVRFEDSMPEPRRLRS